MSGLATASYILPLTLIRRERAFPIQGRVMVRQGETVNPQTVVAEADLAPEHILLNVAAALGVPPQKAASLLQCQEGERLTEGDVIAETPGKLFRKTFRAPVSGTVVMLQGGKVLLRKDKDPIPLRAIYPGTVVDILDDRGVVIENTGALVQAAWGNGRSTYGVVRVVSESADAVLTSDRLDVSLRGAILVGGRCLEEDVFVTAGEISLRGLILGSMPSRLAGAARKAPLPILLTDGFGNLPMNAAAFEFLSTSDGREASVNAHPYNFYRGTRPEVFLPLPSPGKLMPPMPRELSPDDMVKVVTAPYQGQIGYVVRVLSEPHKFSNGIRAAAAVIRFSEDKQTIIPIANLQIIR